MTQPYINPFESADQGLQGNSGDTIPDPLQQVVDSSPLLSLPTPPKQYENPFVGVADKTPQPTTNPWINFFHTMSHFAQFMNLANPATGIPQGTQKIADVVTGQKSPALIDFSKFAPLSQTTESIKQTGSDLGVLGEDVGSLAATILDDAYIPSAKQQARNKELIQHAKGAVGQVIKSFGSVIPTDETFKSVKGAVTTGPIGALGSLANMVIGMPIKTLFGVSGYDTQTGEPIKPEDQVQDMKNAVALAATYGIAKGFHLPSTTAAELNSQGDAALALGDIDKSVMFKQMASQVAPKAGGIIKRIATGAGEGAVTGTVFGGISQAGTPDELAGAIAAGISFAGFGAGLNLLFGKKGSTVPQEVIDQMEQLRQLQSSLNDPLIDASMKTEAISTADNPQQAIINIAKKKPEFLKRSGVARNITDQDQINSALGAGAIYRTNTNGSADLLFPVQDMGPSEIAGWKKSGLLNGDRVSFAGGRLGEVIAQDKESISIVSNDGLLTTFPHELLKYEGSAEPSTFYTGSAFYHPNIFSSIFKDPKIGVLTTDLEALVHVPNAEKIRYNFKNPLVVASNSVFQSILDPDGELFKTAKANGHDGIFVIGPDRTMIISTDVNANIQHLMSVETHTAFGDALKIYREEVEPRIKTESIDDVIKEVAEDHQPKDIPLMSKLGDLENAQTGHPLFTVLYKMDTSPYRGFPLFSEDELDGFRVADPREALHAADEGKIPVHTKLMNPLVVKNIEDYKAMKAGYLDAAEKNSAIHELINDKTNFDYSLKDYLSDPVNGGYDGVIFHLYKLGDNIIDFRAMDTDYLAVDFNPPDTYDSFFNLSKDLQHIAKLEYPEGSGLQNVYLQADYTGLRLNAQDGFYELRDSETNELIGRFSKLEDASKAAANGNPQGPNLEGDGGGPGGNPPPVNTPTQAPGPQPSNDTPPYTPHPVGRMEKIGKSFAAAFAWLEPKRAYMLALDTLHKTKFFSNVYQPLQPALMKIFAERNIVMQEIKSINKMMKGMSPGDRIKVSQWRQSMSPIDVVYSYMPRIMNNEEVVFGRALAGKDGGEPVDLQKIFDYRRKLKSLDNAYAKAGERASPDELTQLEKEKEANKKVILDSIGLSDKELWAAGQMDDIQSKFSPAKFSIGASVRLAESFMKNELSRDDLAKTLDPKIPVIGRRIDEFYSKYAELYGIPKERMLGQYMNHYRKYGSLPDIDFGRELRVEGQPTAKEFLSKLTRTGEISDYIDDPIQAMIDYTHKGLNHLYLDQTLVDARNAAVKELTSLPGPLQNHAARVVNEYLTDARGFPAMTDAAMQDAFDNLMGSMGIKFKANIRRDVINSLNATVSSALLGFKPELAYRDLGTWSSMHFSRFGSVRTANALRYAFETDKDGISAADRLAAAGQNPALSPVDIYSAEELAALQGRTADAGVLVKALDKVGRGAQSFGKLGLKLSLQKNIYGKIHAGAYLEAQRLATKVLLDLKGKPVDAKAAQRLGLDTYDGPVAQHFIDLANSGKLQEAAEFLGQTTATETAFIHGFANHPYGWGTLVGRLATQFGTWPTWARNYMFRMASRGSRKQRLAAMSRFAISQGGIALAGRALGFNTASWQVLPGLAFAGGPFVTNFLDMVDLSGSRGARRQRDQINQLNYNIKNYRNMFIPGSSAFSDYVQAAELEHKGYGWVPIFGKGLGFSVNQQEPSFLDMWTGNNPQLKPRPVSNYDYALQLLERNSRQ